MTFLICNHVDLLTCSTLSSMHDNLKLLFKITFTFSKLAAQSKDKKTPFLLIQQKAILVLINHFYFIVGSILKKNPILHDVYSQPSFSIFFFIDFYFLLNMCTAKYFISCSREGCITAIKRIVIRDLDTIAFDERVTITKESVHVQSNMFAWFFEYRRLSVKM